MFDGRVRDNRAAKDGNDAALDGMYSALKDGDPFNRIIGAPIDAGSG